MSHPIIAFLIVWGVVAGGRIGYLGFVWFVLPRLLYICWVEFPLALLLFLIAPESYWIAYRASPQGIITKDQAGPLFRRTCLVLCVTSLPIALLICRAGRV